MGSVTFGEPESDLAVAASLFVRARARAGDNLLKVHI
jgi:hypothetical protein